VTPPAPAEVEVRRLLPADADADVLGRLTVDAYLDVPGFTAGEGYLAELGDVARRAAQAVVLVAAGPDGTVLGGVTYVPGPGPYAEFEGPDDAGIRMLAVAPRARDRGVGTALVRACVSRARAEGRARLWLHTTGAMTAAHRLYEREGFRRAPGQDRAAGDVHLLAYVLDLTSASEWGRRGSNPH
jgi:GNAT superfamily N-acetyltransferase